MERKATKRGILFLMIGSLLLLTALGWYIYNMVEDANAGKQASALLAQLEEQQAKEKDSPVITVEGKAFCGTVMIERLGVALPVFDEWNYDRLKTAPCRYTGSIATNDMIIAAHNYKNHFGNLKQLQIGDEILFLDPYGIYHRYTVKELTTLDGTAVSDMKAGKWDFTLFTCTKGGKQRVTVRCERVENESPNTQ